MGQDHRGSDYGCMGYLRLVGSWELLSKVAEYLKPFAFCLLPHVISAFPGIETIRPLSPQKIESLRTFRRVWKCDRTPHHSIFLCVLTGMDQMAELSDQLS
jgi:hypothetical protein